MGGGKNRRELIKQGLENGHIVTALVRNPDKLKLSHPNLKVKKGNVPGSYLLSRRVNKFLILVDRSKKILVELLKQMEQ